MLTLCPSVDAFAFHMLVQGYDGQPSDFGNVDPELLYGEGGWCAADSPKFTCGCYRVSHVPGQGAAQGAGRGASCLCSWLDVPDRNNRTAAPFPPSLLPSLAHACFAKPALVPVGKWPGLA